MKLLKSERAATITEVALILPVFILFLTAIMEGGHVLSAWMVLTNSTRETARWAIAAQQQNAALFGTICTGLTGCQNCSGKSGSGLQSCLETNLTAAAENSEKSLLGKMLNPANLTFSPTPSYTDDGAGSVTSVTLSATYNVNTVTPLLQKLVKTFHVYTSATMRVES
jgi:Flp pilus assembly protein TadG